MPVKVKLKGRAQISPGVVSYQLEIMKGRPESRELQIDRSFANSLIKRLERETKRIQGFVQSV